MASDYPVKPWLDPVTKVSFQTVTVRQDDGRYVSIIVSSPRTRYSAKTRKQAEEGVIRRHLSSLRSRIALDDEGEEQDEEDMRVIREAEREGKYLSWKEIRQKYGR
jgi:hypothetical protein